MVNFIDSLISKFILEVCGSTGAIWGTLEVLNVNNENTQSNCRIAALSVGTIFLFRYIYQHFKLYVKNKNEDLQG